MKEHEVFLVSFGVYPPDATLDPLLKRSAYGEGTWRVPSGIIAKHQFYF